MNLPEHCENEILVTIGLSYLPELPRAAMAVDMIGINKCSIAFDNEGTYMVMFNPEIIKRSGLLVSDTLK